MNNDITSPSQIWNFRWFGFWHVSGPERPEIPLLAHWQDATWSPPDKARLTAYLDSAPMVVTLGGNGKAACLVCGAPTPLGAFRSDGDWLWPADLTHYVNMHQVMLPSLFVDHIRLRNFTPPEKVTIPLPQLPWPPPPG